ncbi:MULTISPECIES: hypothetical protein [Rhizobium]|nr:MULTISPECIES: hypothetical protein [Rhizobium]MBB6304942.1 hypothetical protein [Rhizobium leucaenae]MDK4743359.1 hypothetical protein [Rhizobium sp. CNPSo 3464]SCB53054.1 hypothetical protein GA0061101_1617 [Rhizobium lusitanum]
MVAANNLSHRINPAEGRPLFFSRRRRRRRLEAIRQYGEAILGLDLAVDDSRYDLISFLLGAAPGPSLQAWWRRVS